MWVRLFFSVWPCDGLSRVHPASLCLTAGVGSPATLNTIKLVWKMNQSFWLSLGSSYLISNYHSISFFLFFSPQTCRQNQREHPQWTVGSKSSRLLISSYSARKQTAVSAVWKRYHNESRVSLSPTDSPPHSLSVSLFFFRESIFHRPYKKKN